MSQFRRLDGCCLQMSHSIHTLKVQTLTVTVPRPGPARLPHRCGAHKLWVNFLVCFPLQAFQFFFSLWTTQVFVLTAQPSIYCWRFLASLFQFATEKMTRLLSHTVVVLLQECLSQGFLPNQKVRGFLEAHMVHMRESFDTKCGLLNWSFLEPFLVLPCTIFFQRTKCVGQAFADKQGHCPTWHLEEGCFLHVSTMYLLWPCTKLLHPSLFQVCLNSEFKGLHGHQKHQKGWCPFQGRSLAMPHGHLPFPRANPAWRPHQIASRSDLDHHHHNPPMLVEIAKYVSKWETDSDSKDFLKNPSPSHRLAATSQHLNYKGGKQSGVCYSFTSWSIGAFKNPRWSNLE